MIVWGEDVGSTMTESVVPCLTVGFGEKTKVFEGMRSQVETFDESLIFFA